MDSVPKSIKNIIADGTAELGQTLTDRSIEAVNALNLLARSDNIDTEAFELYKQQLVNTIKSAKMTNEIDQEASSLPDDPDDPPVEPKKTSPDSPATSNETQPTPDTKPAADSPKHAAQPTDDELTSTNNADASDGASQEAHNDKPVGKLKAAVRRIKAAVSEAVQPREDQVVTRKR